MITLKSVDSLKRQIRTTLGWVKREILQTYHHFFVTQIITIKGVKLQLGSHISETIRDVIYRGDYEGPELHILHSKLCSDDIVMELGSGLGFLSAYCAQRISNDKIFTYEANPQLECYIRQTYELNHVNPNLEICLVGKGSGEKDFYVSDDFWESSTVSHNKNTKKITIPVKDFNQEIYQINPTFLIIDIEGGEYDLVQHADFFNVKKILIEIHHFTIGEEKSNYVKRRLVEAGFRMNQELSCSQEFFFER